MPLSEVVVFCGDHHACFRLVLFSFSESATENTGLQIKSSTTKRDKVINVIADHLLFAALGKCLQVVTAFLSKFPN